VSIAIQPRPLKLSPEKVTMKNMTVQEKVELMASQSLQASVPIDHSAQMNVGLFKRPAPISNAVVAA